MNKTFITVLAQSWSERAKHIVCKQFSSYMNKKSKKAPSKAEIEKMIQAYPQEFEGRTPASIKTWMYIKRK